MAVTRENGGINEAKLAQVSRSSKMLRVSLTSPLKIGNQHFLRCTRKTRRHDETDVQGLTKGV